MYIFLIKSLKKFHFKKISDCFTSHCLWPSAYRNHLSAVLGGYRLEIWVTPREWHPTAQSQHIIELLLMFDPISQGHYDPKTAGFVCWVEYTGTQVNPCKGKGVVISKLKAYTRVTLSDTRQLDLRAIQEIIMFLLSNKYYNTYIKHTSNSVTPSQSWQNY